MPAGGGISWPPYYLLGSKAEGSRVGDAALYREHRCGKLCEERGEPGSRAMVSKGPLSPDGVDPMWCILTGVGAGLSVLGPGFPLPAGLESLPSPHALGGRGT